MVKKIYMVFYDKLKHKRHYNYSVVEKYPDPLVSYGQSPELHPLSIDGKL